MNVTLNPEKNGIEIRFDEKPDSEILTKLKEHGFRWSNKQKMWYAKQDDERMAMISSLSGEEVAVKAMDVYNLFELTRTDTIPYHFGENPIYDKKEIAAIIRKHLKERFKMCKWSIRSDRNSIYVNILNSPFAKGSEALEAIAEYAYRYAMSYNYNNSDIMTDYFDVNFYGVYRNDIVHYQYEQRESTVREKGIEEDFLLALDEFNKAEEIRLEKEAEEAEKQRLIREEERKKYEAIRKVNHESIVENAKVSDCNGFFMRHLIEPSLRKMDDIKEYSIDNDEEATETDCRITRIVDMDSNTYNLFCNQLMDDYPFLERMGGSNTIDYRVSCMDDFLRMDEQERKSVKWFGDECILVSCDGVPKIVINPEGYNYARYVYFVSDNTTRDDEYQGETGISEEKYNDYKDLSEILIDKSTSIISDMAQSLGSPELLTEWDSGEYFSDYKEIMKSWIREKQFPLSRNVVRVIESDYLKFKMAMYKIIDEMNSAGEQLLYAGLEKNQEITVVQMNDFGWVSEACGKFVSFQNKECRNDKRVEIEIIPEGRRMIYRTYLNKNCLILNGIHHIPQNVFYDVENNGKTITSMSKWSSYDRAQFDAALAYFVSIGVEPIVNTARYN